MLSPFRILLVSASLFAHSSLPTPLPRLGPVSSLASVKVSTLDQVTVLKAFNAKHSRNLAAYALNKVTVSRQAAQESILATAVNLESAAANTSTSTASPAQLFDLVEDGEDVTYLLQVGFGTPAQNDRLVIDTGSGDLWTTWTKVADSKQVGYNPSKSSTADVTNTPFQDVYGTGSVSGVIVTDVVTAGGYTISNRSFGEGTVPDSANTGTPIDGIFPLSSSVLSTQGLPTFFEQLMQNGQVSQPYFSIYLARSNSTTTSSSLVQNGGQLCMGCIPTDVPSSGTIVWCAVTEFAFWTIALGGMSIDGQMISGTSGIVIIDSGTTLALVPTTMAEQIASAMNGQVTSQGAIIVPTSAITDSTQFGVSLGGTTFTMSPIDLVLGYADQSQTSYVLSIMAADITDASGAPVALLGDVFMKNVLSVFSYSHNGAPAVGFVQLSSGSNLNNADIVSTMAAVTMTKSATDNTATGMGANVSKAINSHQSGESDHRGQGKG